MPTRPRNALLRELDFLGQAERIISYLADRGRIDLVHVTFDYPTFFFRLKRRGVPCVATVHHLHLAEALSMLRYESSVPRKIAQMLRASTLTGFEGRLARQCEAVIAVSGFTAETVRRLLSVPREAVRIVKNGIDASEFAGGDPLLFREKFPVLGDKTVLYVGRLERSKGLHYLMPAFARVLSRVPDATMAVVGRGSDEYLAELKIGARSAGISDRVVFTGRISQDLLPHAYAASALVVLPSLMEGFGISLLESMAAERPCVATRVGAVPEIIKHGETGLLVKPADSQELGGAMATLLSDPALRAAMGKKGLETVKRDFTLARMTSDTVQVYKELVVDR
ncbi:MAG: glycosyltransferase family 4 protein [Thaumarchaeota archaeon]|nr:glycosyltransferase family 4 protein [Nitrososphaerota archaeon]